MKILFLATRGFDYIQDLAYSGLVEVLGRSAISEIPWNPKFHLRFWDYPKNLGYSQFNLPELKPLLRFDRFDAVVVGACKKDAFSTYLEIQRKISPRTVLIFLDGGDLGEVAGDLHRESAYSLFSEAEAHRPFDIIFKREMLEGVEYEPRVFPLPMSIKKSAYSSISYERSRTHRYGVSFWAVESHPVRSFVFEVLEDRFDCKQNGSVKGQTFQNYARKGVGYLQALSDCKIILNFRGAGWDTLRYWEVPGIGGFLISQKPEIVMEQPFVDGTSIVYLNKDLSDLTEKCDFYLKNDKAREKIARAGHLHAHAFHLNTHRAKTIIEQISLRQKNFR